MNERYNEQDPAPQYDPEAARIRRALRARKARRSRQKRLRRLAVLLVLAVCAALLLPGLWKRAERMLYPRKYEALVERWADTYDLDPLLVDAFIRTESGFDPQATSTVDYLHLCMERYNGDVATAAAAYHSGWGTVDALLQMEEHSADGETLQGFPYSQMNHYVKKITFCYAEYQRIYAGS